MLRPRESVSRVSFVLSAGLPAGLHGPRDRQSGWALRSGEQMSSSLVSGIVIEVLDQ